ncbi:Arm DNA-binding domain-containing protein [Secundilactobacillus folii]|nr:Arm DNA-binding domain-containing protein [Secundilactobacillus folii]
MATFKKYEDRHGNERWSFQAYLGIDPATGKSVKTTRRGFKHKKEAQLAMNRLK